MAAFSVSKAANALAMPEILDMIFQYLDKSSNTSNARVCKRWSDLALDSLWKEVKDIYRLFNILAPLDEVTPGKYAFKRPLEASDWRRFDHYRRRVRRLFYNCETGHTLHQSVFDDIARSRTSLDILPCLYALNWHAPLSLSVMFMHKNVKIFAVYLPEDADGVGPLFDDVLARMPNLTHLDLRFDASIKPIESATANVLRMLRNLKKLILPQFCFTSNIAESVSRLENLEAVEFQYFKEQGRGDVLDVVDFKPTLSEGSFPSLWDLSLTVSFDNATRFLNASFAPTNLTILYLDSSRFETPAAILHLITTVASNCQLLKSLSLLSFVDPSTVSEADESSTLCITLDTLRPLLACPNLTSLELVHQYPLALSHADIEVLAKCWPSAESLLLNTEPAALTHSPLTLSSLLPFAQHCPRLSSLGLFLDASVSANLDLLAPQSSPDPLPMFQSLRRLSMGVSILPSEDTNRVALFLSHVCPPPCDTHDFTLDSGVTWEFLIGEVAGAVEARCDAWNKILEVLPLLTRLRQEERERARALREEVEELRWRNGVLVEMAKVKARKDEVDSCVAV